MAALTLTCPRCQQPIVVPATIVHSDHARGTALVQIDQDVARAHLEACQPAAPKAVEAAGPSQADLAGRVERFLSMRAYIATGGSRACKMCGANGVACLDQLQGQPGVPCCAACGEGNTHPSPKDTLACAEWATEHHQAQQ